MFTFGQNSSAVAGAYWASAVQVLLVIHQSAFIAQKAPIKQAEAADKQRSR